MVPSGSLLDSKNPKIQPQHWRDRPPENGIEANLERIELARHGYNLARPMPQLEPAARARKPDQATKSTRNGEGDGRESERTLEEEPLGSLVGIHVAQAEHGVDLLVGVAAGDFLDVGDRAPHPGGDRNPTAGRHLRRRRRRRWNPHPSFRVTLTPQECVSRARAREICDEAGEGNGNEGWLVEAVGEEKDLSGFLIRARAEGTRG